MSVRPSTSGFIDATSIRGTLAVLIQGRGAEFGLWDRQSILEVSYLLLHGNFKIVPGTRDSATAVGLYSHVVEAFPWLEVRGYQRLNAERQSQRWLKRYQPLIRREWQKLRASNSFNEWSTTHKRLFWPDDIKMYGALYSRDAIPAIAALTGLSETDLNKVRDLSTNMRRATRWAVSTHYSEEVEVAERAWLLSALMRGKFHEYVARDLRVQLLPHQFREGISGRVGRPTTFPALEAELLFIKMIIGSALLESTAPRRVRAWVDGIARARAALAAKKIALPDLATQADAERAAARAAKDIGLYASGELIRRALDVAVSIGLGTLLSVEVSPWFSPLAPISQQIFRHFRGKTIGDDIERAILHTSWRFKKLARSFPGRIDRVWFGGAGRKNT